MMSADTCPNCGAEIRYTTTPSSAPDLGRFVAIEDFARECGPECTATDDSIIEAITERESNGCD